MAKVRRERTQRKPKGEGSGGSEGKPGADLWSLPADEGEAIIARVRESVALELRLAPYEMLTRNDAHERELAKNVQKAAKEAKLLAGRLTKLSEFLAKIDKQRRGGPLARWLWASSPEGRLSAYSASPPRNPPPWEQKPKGGVAVVADIIARAFDKNIARTLGEEAARSKARKGGRPRAVLFNAACRLLYETRSERETAEMLLTAHLAKGGLAKVQERVRVAWNRLAKNRTKPIHEHAETIEEIHRIQQEETRRLIAEGRLPERIGGPESTK
ncbi:MAG: hypothetical protein ABSF35_00935 [Polyangia bacterium]